MNPTLLRVDERQIIERARRRESRERQREKDQETGHTGHTPPGG